MLWNELSGQVVETKLVGCGSDSKQGHSRYFKNGTHCLPVWLSIKGWTLGLSLMWIFLKLGTSCFLDIQGLRRLFVFPAIKLNHYVACTSGSSRLLQTLRCCPSGTWGTIFLVKQLDPRVNVWEDTENTKLIAAPSERRSNNRQCQWLGRDLSRLCGTHPRRFALLLTPTNPCPLQVWYKSKRGKNRPSNNIRFISRSIVKTKSQSTKQALPYFLFCLFSLQGCSTDHRVLFAALATAGKAAGAGVSWTASKTDSLINRRNAIWSQHGDSAGTGVKGKYVCAPSLPCTDGEK